MLAENILSGEKCALKVMKNGKGRDYQYIQQMLKAEVSYLKELNHDNIIKVIDYSNKEVFINSRKSEIDVSYIATEYAENGEFFDYIAEGEKFSEKTARYFFHKLIDALDHVHSSGIAHRDIKPENLLLDSQFTLKLGDFGFWTKDKISKSKRGTLGYMAPEILAGSKYDAKKSDLFSTAVILFIMVTQHCPFIRADTNDRYYKKIIGNDMDEFWKFHSDFEGYSEEFKDLFWKMISVNPDDRLSIDEVREHKWFKGPLPLSSDIIFEFQLRKKALLSNNDNEWTSDKKGENNEFLAENGKSSKTNNRSDSSSSSNSNSSSDDEDTIISDYFK